VHWFCALVLCIGFVHWFCALVLCIGFMHWFYALVLCIGFVHWFYALVLCIGYNYKNTTTQKKYFIHKKHKHYLSYIIMKFSLLYLSPLFLNLNMVSGLNFGLNTVRSFATNIRIRGVGNAVGGGAGLIRKLNMRKKNVDFSSDMRYMSPVYKPRTENQGLYVKYLCNKDIPIVIGVGPAGSGKTLFACNQAVLALKSGAVDKIILTRPVVPVEEDIGFLPGSLINKMDPWTRPIFDILLEFYQQKDIDGMLHSGALEISPLAYMRGRTFKRAFVIADEMQNSSPNQMLMLTTRIGDGSKLVITGDLKQSDRGINNGLADIMNKIKSYRDFRHDEELGIRIVEMAGKDIQRSPIVAKLLDIYCGKPTVSPHAPSLSLIDNTELGDMDGDVDSGVDGDSDGDVDGYNVRDIDWSIGVENVSMKISNTPSSIQNDVFIDKVSKVDDIGLDNGGVDGDNDAALIPLKHTKSKYFPNE